MTTGGYDDGGRRFRCLLLRLCQPRFFWHARWTKKQKEKQRLLALLYYGYYNVALAKGLEKHFNLTRGILSKVYLLLRERAKKENEHCAAFFFKSREHIR